MTLSFQGNNSNIKQQQHISRTNIPSLYIKQAIVTEALLVTIYLVRNPKSDVSTQILQRFPTGADTAVTKKSRVRTSLVRTSFECTSTHLICRNYYFDPSYNNSGILFAIEINTIVLPITTVLPPLPPPKPPPPPEPPPSLSFINNR